MSTGNNQVEGNLKGEDMLSDIREQCMTLMLENDVPEKKAAAATETLLKEMRKSWGGLLIYFKKGEDLTDRDYDIYHKYNGKNRDQLCREYDISVQRLYQIVRSVKALEIAKRQVDCFKDE